MPDSTRKKVLDSVLKALLASIETNALIKGGGTLVSELSQRFSDLPDEEKSVLESVTAEEWNDAFSRIKFTASHSAEAAAGVYRVEENQAEILTTVQAIAESVATLDARTSPPSPLAGLSIFDRDVLRLAGDQVIRNNRLQTQLNVGTIIEELHDLDGVTRSVRHLTELGYFSRGDVPNPRFVMFKLKGFDKYARSYRQSYMTEYNKVCVAIANGEYGDDESLSLIHI